jgi:hypothetical protein
MTDSEAEFRSSPLRPVSFFRLSFFFSFLGEIRIGVWNQGFPTCKAGTLYHLSHTSSPLCSDYFWRWGSLSNYLPGLTLILSPPDFNLPSSKDYNHEPPALSRLHLLYTVLSQVIFSDACWICFFFLIIPCIMPSLCFCPSPFSLTVKLWRCQKRVPEW